MAILTVYPDPNPETTSVDGQAQRSLVDENLATIRAGAGTSAEDTFTSVVTVEFRCSATTNQFDTISRGFYLFDTSSLGSGVTISSAILSLMGLSGKFNNISGGTPEYDIGASSPASNTAIVASDYSTVSYTNFSTGISFTNFASESYNDFTLNASGISNISLAGISKFSGLSGWDINNNFDGTWSSGVVMQINNYMADNAGTTKDPKLVITYSPTGMIQKPKPLRPRIFGPGLAR